MDKVAVLMSTYNGEKYLSIQIDSILAQEGVEVELYIRDDGSSDSTVEIINKYAEKDKRVKFVPGPPLGVGRSFMTLLGLNIDADYFSFADQDDYWYKNKLKDAIVALRGDDNDRSLYCCNQNCVDADGNFLFQRFPSDYPVPSLISVVLKNYFAGCTFVFGKKLRKEILSNLPPFTFFDLVLHDAWIVCVASAVGKIIFDHTSHMDFRRHEGTFSDESVGTNRRKSLFRIYLNKIQRYHKITRKKRNVAKKRAQYINEYFITYLTDIEKEDISMIASYDTNVKCKIRLLTNKRIRAQNTAGFLFYIAILFNIA